MNKFMLTRDRVMPELQLGQPRLTQSGCGPFTKYCERIKKFRETGNVKQIYKNQLDKTCFGHDAE